jgi:hypothetical protein
MAAPFPWQYPFAVDSIASAHPGMPAYLDTFDVHAHKAAGDPFDPAAALQAEKTVTTLRGMSGIRTSSVINYVPPNSTSDQDPNVTPAVLNAAANRALVLRELGKPNSFTKDV